MTSTPGPTSKIPFLDNVHASQASQGTLSTIESDESSDEGLREKCTKHKGHTWLNVDDGER